jgi:phospholipase A1
MSRSLLQLNAPGSQRFMRCALTAMFVCASAQAGAAEDLETCRALANDAVRLACYDRVAGRPVQPITDPVPAQGRDASEIERRLSVRMELDQKDKRGTFLFSPYRPVYVLPLRVMHEPNALPASPNPDNTVTQPLPLDKTEAKFQLSFKTKIWENIFASPADLWFGYTQQSYWQVYNKSDSSPFRETDYEPEVFTTIPLSLGDESFKLRYLNLGFVHQSNGRSNPMSRSWNRLYAGFGFQTPSFILQFRPWYRIPEKAAHDDNPDISDYVGRAELSALYRWDKQEFTLTGRHSLKGGSANHGSLQLEWSFPLKGYLRAHFQAFTGYGESLIDYNHRQTTFGLGISLMEWL